MVRLTLALDAGPTPAESPDRFDDREWLSRLVRAHNWELPQLTRLLSYYDGRQRLSYMHPELINLVGDRVRQLVVNWPRLVVDSLEERIDLHGFRFPDEPHRDDDLQRIFEYNHLDAGYQQAHVAALLMRRAYAIVGANTRPGDERYPLITVESPLDVHVELDPGTRQVVAGVKRWGYSAVLGGSSLPESYATLYRPDHTVTYVAHGGDWLEVQRDQHDLGRVPVVPIVNRPQLWAPLGTSELDDVIPISDAACKVATDMMISAEFHAMPRRYALGMDESDFQDREGKWISAWRTVAGVLWSTPKNYQDDGVQLGQFSESDLTNFHDTLRALAVQVGAVTGLPMHTLGYSSDNPASASGINAAADRHIKRAERRIRTLEQAWEEIARTALLVRDGSIPQKARWLETDWADASTPTFAAKSDAVTKLYQADRLVPRRTARRTLGFTMGQIAEMEQEDEADAARFMFEPDRLVGPRGVDDEDGDGDESGPDPRQIADSRSGD